MDIDNLFNTYSIDIIDKSDNKPETKELSQDILLIYRIYWYYLEKFYNKKLLSDKLKQKLSFFMKFQYINTKYSYLLDLNSNHFRMIQKYSNDDSSYELLTTTLSNDLDTISDKDIELCHDYLFDLIIICRRSYDNISNITRNIFISDNNIIPILNKYPNITKEDNNKIIEIYGDYWEQFWLLNGLQTKIECSINIKFYETIIPLNCNYILFKQICLDILPINKDIPYYCWCFSNPSIYFKTLLEREFQLSKRNIIVKKYNFRENTDLIETIKEIYAKDFYNCKNDIKIPIINLFKTIVFTQFQTIPVSLDYSKYWISGNIVLDSDIQKIQDINYSEKSINNCLSIGNNFIFISKDKLEAHYSEEHIYNLFPIIDINYNYDYYEFSLNTDIVNSNNFINNTNILNLYSSNIILDSNIKLGTLFYKKTLTNKKCINLRILFNEFILNNKIVASYLNTNNDIGVKLYTPIMVFNSDNNIEINKNNIIDWFNLDKELIFDDYEIKLKQDKKNFISFLINIGININKNKQQKVIVNNWNEINGEIIVDLLFKNNKIIKNISINDILINKSDIPLIENKEILIYDFNILLATLYIYNNGTIEYNIPYSNIDTINIIKNMDGFIESINNINYLNNPFYNFPIKHNLYLINNNININNNDFILKSLNTYILEKPINISILQNLFLSFSPIFKILQKEIIPETNIECLETLDGTKKWILAKVLKKINNNEAEISYIYNNQTITKIINISITQIRFIRDRKLHKSIKLIVDPSGINSNITEITYYIYLFKQLNIEDVEIIKLLNQYFNINKVIANKIFNIYKKQPINFPNIGLININILDTNSIKIELENINNHNKLLLINKFIRYILNCYDIIVDIDGNIIKDINIFNKDKTFINNYNRFLSQNNQSLISNILNLSNIDDVIDVDNISESSISSEFKIDDLDDLEINQLTSYYGSDLESDDDEDLDIEVYKPDVNDIFKNIDIDSDDEDDDEIPVNNIENISINDFNKLYDVREKEFTQFSELKRRGPFLERLNYLFKDSQMYEEDESVINKVVIGKNCQGDGQPMAISNDTKQFIDTHFANSYGSNLEISKNKHIKNLDCDGSSLINTENIEGKQLEQCRSIKIKNYWLICPKISCYYCWISLGVDVLTPNTGHLNPYLLIERTLDDNNLKDLLDQYALTYNDFLMYNYTLIDKLPKIIDNTYDYTKHKLNFKCNKFRSKDPLYQSDNWSFCINCNTSIYEHNVFCPMCNKGILFERTFEKFSKIKSVYKETFYETELTKWKIKQYNNNNWDSLKIQKTTLRLIDIPREYKTRVNSIISNTIILFEKPRALKIVFKKKDNDLIRNYPAFTNAGFPCCYKSYSKSFLQNTNDYFQREGILTQDNITTESEINYILKDTESVKPLRKCLLPNILKDFFETVYHEPNFNNCFLRYGIPYNNNSIFTVFTKILNERDSSLGYTIETFKLDFLSKIVNIFPDICDGKIKNIFTDPNGKISSLQNFIEFTYSSQNKPYYFYLDYFEKIYDIHIIFLHFNDEEDLYIHCSDSIKKINTKKKYAFVLKRKFGSFSILELLFYNKSSSGQYIFSFDKDEPKSWRKEEDETKKTEIILGAPIIKSINNAINIYNQYPKKFQSDIFVFDYIKTNMTAFRKSLKKKKNKRRRYYT